MSKPGDFFPDDKPGYPMFPFLKETQKRREPPLILLPGIGRRLSMVPGAGQTELYRLSGSVLPLQRTLLDDGLEAIGTDQSGGRILIVHRLIEITGTNIPNGITALIAPMDGSAQDPISLFSHAVILTGGGWDVPIIRLPPPVDG